MAALFEWDDSGLEGEDDLDDVIDSAEHRSSAAFRPTILPVANIEMMQTHEFADYDQNFKKSPADLKLISRTISDIVLFERVDADQMESVVQYFYLINVKAGDVVIEEGDEGDAFYVVKTGKYSCEALKDGKNVHIMDYEDSGYFGDLALIYNAPRSATITAVTDGELFVLNAMRYHWVQKRQAMKNAMELTMAIKHLPLLRHGVDPKVLTRLVDALKVVYYPAETFVFHEGDMGEAMYFVLEGEIDIIKEGKLIDTLLDHEFFGERSLVFNEPRAASCRVKKRAKLGRLSKSDFCHILSPDIIEDMKDYIISRYEEKDTGITLTGVQMVIDDSSASDDEGNDDADDPSRRKTGSGN